MQSADDWKTVPEDPRTSLQHLLPATAQQEDKERRHLEKEQGTNTQRWQFWWVQPHASFTNWAFQNVVWSTCLRHLFHFTWKKQGGAIHSSARNLFSFLQRANNKERGASSMQKEPTVFAVAIGCEQLLLHNMRVSSVYIAGGFHVTTLNSAIHIKSSYPWTKNTNTKEKETRKRLVCIFSCVLWLPLLAFPCKLHSWCSVLLKTVKVCDSLSGLICCIRRYTWVLGYDGGISISISSNTLLWSYLLYTGDNSQHLSVELLGPPGHVTLLALKCSGNSRHKIPLC